VEAGIRHYDTTVPEEVNRLITDHLSVLLFCPTERSVAALQKEGIRSGVHLVGDILLDSTLSNREIAAARSHILEELGILPGRYYLATVHRPVNTDDPERLISIFAGLAKLDKQVVVPLHPRTRSRLHDYGSWEYLTSLDNLVITEPVGYLDFLKLEQNAALILTDSGGVQREAYFLGVPCVTLQAQCPWPETVQDGWNKLVSPDRMAIVQAVRNFHPPHKLGTAFGDGTASRQIVKIIEQYLEGHLKNTRNETGDFTNPPRSTNE
jgi:UDP-N-acetylglucosamine 2-epimerase (non-hydrolysing)